MKVCYVVHDNKKGGAAISFLEMINEIRQKYDVFVLTPHKKGFIPEQLTKMGIAHKNAHYYWWFVKLPKTKALRTVKKVIYNILVRTNFVEAKRIARKLKKDKIDLIHTNGSVVNFGGYLARDLGVPHVWHIREIPDYFDLQPVMRKEKINLFMKNHADCMIAISNAVSEVIQERTKSDKIRMIYNGISDECNLKKDKYRQPTEEVKFLIAGNVYKEKGQEDVLEAVSILIGQGITAFHVDIAGGGDTSQLERIIKDNHIETFVSLLGLVKNMSSLRQKTDVEIVASKWEAFGRVTIEAMRSSNPVIGTNSGGTKELINPNRNGLLYSYGDVAALAECMRKFIETPELIETMGKQAYRDTIERFTPAQNAEMVMDVYRELMIKRKG
ncbi:MAG: glycosyltransferase family 4 protein [Lachnospiraceae bacterium]|nr:glycosyltransferase family 4 protein [Lachnospiraceae bacterium]